MGVSNKKVTRMGVKKKLCFLPLSFFFFREQMADAAQLRDEKRLSREGRKRERRGDERVERRQKSRIDHEVIASSVLPPVSKSYPHLKVLPPALCGSVMECKARLLKNLVTTKSF